MNKIKRIAIIGNSCGGKTWLSLKLAARHQLPLIHVDQIQFMKGLVFRPFKESVQILKIEQEKTEWIIDGFGPLDILHDRLKLADQIIMIDLPIKIHYLWAVKRILKNLFQRQRPELPAESSERNLRHIIKLFKTIHQVHTKMRPEMLRILTHPSYTKKTVIIQNTHALRNF